MVNNVKICVDNCNSDEFIQGQECVPKCDTRVASGQACTDSCP